MKFINYNINFLWKFKKNKSIKLIFLCIIFINVYLFHWLNIYCHKCKINYNYNCRLCPREIIFNGINIASRKETLDEIKINNKSLARFGDGEFKIIFGLGIGFHRTNKLLKMKLLNVLKSNLDKLLVGINLPYREQDLNSRPALWRNYWKNFIKKYKFKIANLLNVKRKYYFALVFKYSIVFKNKKKFDIPNYIKKLKTIWHKRDILIIEGLYTRSGIGNDLFNNAKSIKRILCPPKNAFNIYAKLIRKFKNLKLSKNTLILISLGPVASVLSYDICKLGFQALDIGHADIEYELYLRNYNSYQRIPYKYVDQAKNGNKNILNVTDENYYKQIILKILH